MAQHHRHDNYVTFGPNVNCTLAVCPVDWSVYEYRPSVPANVTLLVLFGVSLLIHLVQGLRWRTWSFMIAMILGCIDEIIGYAGRLMLYNNPFTFPGFLIQIICITTAAAFFSAAIYLTLSKIVLGLDPSISRFRPQFFYWFFIPCDIVSLTLQAAGGALSSTSLGSNQNGVNISLAGLSFQVFTLIIFIALSLDYAVRYYRHSKIRATTRLSNQFRVFVFFLSLAILLILIRCAYRIDELSDGYDGPLIHNQGLFIALEGVMIIVSCFCLNIAHPGPVFNRRGECQVVNKVEGDIGEI